MHRKRHGALGAAVALLTLVAALLCATGAAQAPRAATGSATVASAQAAQTHEALKHSGQRAPDAVAAAPCLKKAQPERQPRIHAPLPDALPAGSDTTGPGRASPHTCAPRRAPAESPPDLAELSVRRV